MSHFDWEDFLRQHHLFLSLSKGEIEWLLRDDVSKKRECQKDAVILREGDRGDTLFLIGAGSVRIILVGEKAQEVPLSILSAGEIFGEMAVVEQRPRAATVITEEDCILLEIKGREFCKLLNRHADIEFKIILELSERLRSLNRALVVKVKGVDEKLDLFRAELQAELKAVEAALKAAQTVFDQTKMRTDEVITSAERNRTRMAMAGTLISVVVMGLGWFGLKEFLNIRHLVIKARSAIEIQVKDANDKAEKINVTAKEIQERVKDVNDKAEKIDVTAKRQENLYQEAMQLVDKSKKTLVKHIFWPNFDIAVSEGNRSGNAVSLYNAINEIQPFKDEELGYILKTIEWKFSDTSEIKNTPPKYMELLTKIRQDVQSLESKAKAYYLHLANAILADPKEFKPTLDQFQRYMEYYPYVRVKQDDVRKLEIFFAEDDDKGKLFASVRQIIRTD